ncbi:NAD(P)H-hydrate dehydratase [Brotaphodocola sp.]|uniref:NAD(P)H-hydrate dehydratase n=1 Tax=Brotaphodocola sp. TaxID=3073577 RepID=UPI003D7C6D98
MRYFVTGRQMKQIDQDTIERIGIPSLVLMERAALAIADAVEEMIVAEGKSGKSARILIACGTGNNGADGIAAGRILCGRGYEAVVLLGGNPDHETEEHRRQQRIAEALGVPIVREESESAGSWNVIVDAVFGIGLTREITGEWKTFLEHLCEIVRRDSAKVVAADTPSGIHSQTGRVMGIALRADLTVTFGYGKTGLFLYPGRTYAGNVRVAEVGFSNVSLKRAGWDCTSLEEADLAELPARQPDGNKGTFGKVLVIAGSRGMSGAAYFSALAAYRTGAGLVKVLTVPENRTVIQMQLPEAVVSVYDPEAIAAEEHSTDFLREACDWADVIVLGPGLGQEPYVEYLVEAVLEHAYVPLVLDADGLNTVASHPYLTRYFTENIILTPHMGEMARLCSCPISELKEDPVQAVKSYSSRYGVTCVMKDASTVISDKDGNVWLNTSGCSAMAKGGSGDVLTGVIAGLLARGMDCDRAAAFGVFLHGLAGETAAVKYGENGVLARSLADAVAQTEKENRTGRKTDKDGESRN